MIIWDDRLISRAQAADMCGTWQIKIDNADYDINYLRCGICDGNITRLPSSGLITYIDNLMAAVVRHMSMNHDYPLSGRAHEGTGDDAAAAGGPSRWHHAGRAADPVH
jgi:hypothetical protein